MEIKIRYTFKRKSDGHIWQEIKDITSIEVGFPISMILNDNELLGRDLWTGLQDLTKTDIYTNDIVVTPKGVSKVILLNGGFRAPIPGSNYRLSGWIHSTNNVEKIGDIYTTPELIEK